MTDEKNDQTKRSEEGWEDFEKRIDDLKEALKGDWESLKDDPPKSDIDDLFDKFIEQVNFKRNKLDIVGDSIEAMRKQFKDRFEID